MTTMAANNMKVKNTRSESFYEAVSRMFGNWLTGLAKEDRTRKLALELQRSEFKGESVEYIETLLRTNKLTQVM